MEKKRSHIFNMLCFGSKCICSFTDDSCCSKTSVLLFPYCCMILPYLHLLAGNIVLCTQSVIMCKSLSKPQPPSLCHWLTAVWSESKTAVSQSSDPVTQTEPGSDRAPQYHIIILLYDKLHCCNDWYSASSSNVKLKSVNFVVYVCSHFYGCALQFLFFQNQLVNLPKPCIIILISYTCP